MNDILRIISCILPLTLLSACLFEPRPFAEEAWRQAVEETEVEDLYVDNHTGGSYSNPWMPQSDRSFTDFLRWQLSRAADYGEAARHNSPTFVPNLSERIRALPADTDFLTWIGHATFLFRIDGQYWLTDPMFSQRALLPKRVSPPALTADDLAGLEGRLTVLISHNHYDHLDKSSIEALPPGSTFIVPEGLGDYVSSFAPGPVSELNWWGELPVGPAALVTSLPAQHWSRRIFQGYNRTLWASYMVSTEEVTVYFGGDSGYFKGYREIGRLFPRIDYALLPITAYQPRWFMHYAHMNTSEAITAFEDLGASYFIPSQWGTFHLGDNPPGLPPLDLRRDIDRTGKDPNRFLILGLGEIRILSPLKSASGARNGGGAG